MVSLVDLVTEEEEDAQAAHPIMLDPLVECVRAQTIECVNEVCMALAKYLRQKKTGQSAPKLSKAFLSSSTVAFFSILFI